MRIYTQTLEKIGEIDNYESLQFGRSWHDIGKFELRLSNDVEYAESLFDDNFILMDQKRVGVITGYAVDENNQRVVKGFQLKRILSQRIITPPAGTTHDRRYADAETVMKHYVDRHVMYPSNSDRIIPNFVMNANQKRGPYLQWESRLKNLAEEEKEISQASGLGWDVWIDEDLRHFVFDVFSGKNLTRNQTTYPPVVFSVELDNVLKREFEKDTTNYKNIAYVGGQGEGETRSIVEVSLKTVSGLSRKEVFIDARDLSNQTEENIDKPESEIVKMLTDRGKQKLESEHNKSISFSCVISEKPGMEYEKDWSIGDTVTCYDNDIGITMDTVITDVEEIYQNNTRELQVTFGAKKIDIAKLLQRELSQVKNLIRN